MKGKRGNIGREAQTKREGIRRRKGGKKGKRGEIMGERH